MRLNRSRYSRGISVRTLWRACRNACVALTLSAAVLSAQTAYKPTATELGQIVDATLQAVLPSSTVLSTWSVAERGVRFDYRRTLEYFGIADDQKFAERRGIRSEISEGTRELLHDCTQVGVGTCPRLGRSAYVFMEPVSSTRTKSVVKLHVAWANVTGERRFLTGFSTEVHLARTRAGTWTFVRTGRTAVG